MPSHTVIGILLVALAGLLVGSGAWPMKLMKQFQLEHWWFLAMLTGLIILPWSVIQQASQMLGGQGLGFISGEWRGVTGRPRRQMYFAIACLIVAAFIMAWGNTLTG